MCGAEIDYVCIFIFVCVVFVVVVAWVLFSLFLKGNLCNYTNKTKKYELQPDLIGGILSCKILDG